MTEALCLRSVAFLLLCFLWNFNCQRERHFLRKNFFLFLSTLLIIHLCTKHTHTNINRSDPRLEEYSK